MSRAEKFFALVTETETADENRQADGKYGITGDMTRCCARCGQSKGIHDTVRPYPVGDASLGKLCAGWKAARKAK